MRRGLALLLLAALLAGCAPLRQLAGVLNTATPVPTRRPTPTRPPVPTSTATVAMPSATPAVPLNQEGPWLTYLAASKQGTQVIAANPDGSGRTVVAAFPDLYVPLLSRPAAKGATWFSLLNGRDSTLTLFELPAGAARETFLLLSNLDLTDNQREMYAAMLMQGQPASLSWSPDGRSLAFTGAMNGPFTDIYLFDSQDGSSRRLTERLGESYFPVWSPDGKMLLVQEQQDSGAGKMTVAAVDALGLEDDSLAILYRPKSAGERILGWLDPATFVTVSRRAAGWVEARRYLMEERKHALLQYSGPMELTALDPERGALAFTTAASGRDTPTLPAGLYWTSTVTGAVTVMRGKWSRLEYAPEAKRFFAAGPGLVLSFAPNSEKVSFTGEENLPAVAPDGKWLAFYSPESTAAPGLRLYGPDGKRGAEITKMPVQEVVWQADASGLLFVSNGDLYRASLKGGQPEKVDSGVSSPGWVGGR